MKELSLSESTDLIMEIILGESEGYNPIGSNTGRALSESEDKQEHAKLRVIEQLFEWEKEGYKIVKVDREKNE